MKAPESKIFAVTNSDKLGKLPERKLVEVKVFDGPFNEVRQEFDGYLPPKEYAAFKPGVQCKTLKPHIHGIPVGSIVAVIRMSLGCDWAYMGHGTHEERQKGPHLLDWSIQCEVPCKLMGDYDPEDPFYKHGEGGPVGCYFHLGDLEVIEGAPSKDVSNWFKPVKLEDWRCYERVGVGIFNTAGVAEVVIKDDKS